LDLRSTRSEQFLVLRTAATRAYSQLSGRAPDAHDAEVLHRLLNDVAHALAIVAPIYVLKDGKAIAVDARFLISGRFVRGGAAMVGEDGIEQTDLVIQRRELDAAISILQMTSLGKALRSTGSQP
jgi:hypothetical protein